MTKFHKAVIKMTGLRDQTQSIKGTKGKMCVTWIKIELDEITLVLNGVKFHKFDLNYSNWTAEIIGVMYMRAYGGTYGRTGLTLNVPAIAMTGA